MRRKVDFVLSIKYWRGNGAWKRSEIMMASNSFASGLRAPLVAAGRILLLACLLLSAAPYAGATTLPSADPGAGPGPQGPATPYLVVENMGQYATEARFLLQQGDRRIWLTDDALWLTVPDPLPVGEQVEPTGRGRHARRDRLPSVASRPGTALRFTFPGANPAAALEPYGRVPTHVSYLIGNDPARWQRDVPVWSGVRYHDLYPGVDLWVGTGAAGTLPWRFEAKPGADLNAVSLRIEGADRIATAAGQLQLDMKGHSITLALPTWSLAGQAAPLVSAAVRSADGTAEFDLSPEAQPQLERASAAGALGVDAGAADLIYSSFLGVTSWERGRGIAVDWQGNAYVTGSTDSADFPLTPGYYDGSFLAGEAFVAKFNTTGTALLYATYLGGSDQDLGWGIAVDGNLAYAVGDTSSDDFPGTMGKMGQNDIFVVALNATGSDIRYATLLGSTGYDYGYGIAVEDVNAYVVGSTSSADETGNLCGAIEEMGNVVVAKLDALGQPVYTTCLGGNDTDEGYEIAVLAGAAYVTGESHSTDLGWNSQAGDILLARFNADGTLDTKKLIGGTDLDYGNGIAVDGAGSVYVTGSTLSDDFPVTAGALGGSSDAVVLKLNSNLTSGPAVYLGGDGAEEGWAIAVDTVQGLYAAGSTDSTNFPKTTGAFDEGHNGLTDAFVARMHMDSAAANKVTYATYLGGAQGDFGYGVATDTGGHAFVTGATASTAFPTANAYDSQLNGDDGFVAKLKVSSPPGAPNLTITASGSNANLGWGAVGGAARYQVFRSSRPYFKPGDWSSPLPLVEPTGLSHGDPVLADASAYFYVVKAVSAAPEAGPSSKLVGKFSFGLVPGGN